MKTKNFTPIDDLIQKNRSSSSAGKPKEAEPTLPSSESFEIQEVVEHKPEKELYPFLTPTHETIELPPDLKKLGLQSVSTTQFPSYQNIKLPISDEKVVVGLSAPITSSIRWLATLALYLLQQAHLTIKVVQGKVIRVLRR